MVASPVLAGLSPYERWVCENWLSTDTRGDVNNDGVCNLGDFALAAEEDVGKIVIWGRTRQIAEESLLVAIDEAIYEGKLQLATSYRVCYDQMINEDLLKG